MALTEKEIDIALEKARKIAESYIEKSGLNLLDLSESNSEKVDKFLKNVYKDWKLSKIDDLTANAIAEILEGEPIHHLLKISVYPLCDISHQYYQGNVSVVRKWKEKYKI